MPRSIVQRWSIQGRDNTRPAVLSANRGLRSIGATAKQTNFTVGALAVRLGAVAAAYAALRNSAQAVNTVQNLNNRINLVANNRLAETKDLLFDVARQTFASYNSTAQFFSKLALSSKELGKSQEELVKVVSIANKTVAISGSTAESAANGLIQFAQGIASNRLAGDELRSVLENLPPLADAIARGMGVTRGEVRELAAQGKLTGKAVIDALLAQEDEVNEYFKNFNLTIALSAQQFGNSFLKAIDKLEAETGGLKFIAMEIVGVADALSELTDDTVEFLRETGGIEKHLHDLRVELELLKLAAIATVTYFGSAAVIKATLAIAAALNKVALAAAAAWGGILLPVGAGTAAYYLMARAITSVSDYLSEAAEKANIMSRNVAELEINAAHLGTQLERWRALPQSPHNEEVIAKFEQELQVVNDLIKAQKLLIDLNDEGPKARRDLTQSGEKIDVIKDKTAPNNDAIIMATEARNRRLAQLRAENEAAELASMIRAGELGMAELEKQIRIRTEAETSSLQRRMDEAVRIAEIEREQRDTKIALMIDSQDRDIAFAEAAYADRVARIEQEISDEVAKNRLLEEEERLHLQNMAQIRSEYDVQDADRQSTLLDDAKSFWGALAGDSASYYGEEAKYKKGDAKHAKENEEFKQRVMADGVKSLAKHSKAAFNIVKVAKIAQAVMDTYSGINRALGEYPPPTSFVLAAAVAAAGFANVASIASQQYGGGGGGRRGASGGGGSVSTTRTSVAQTPQYEPAAPERQTIINVTPGLYSGEDIQMLVEEINKAGGDNVNIKVGIQ